MGQCTWRHVEGGATSKVRRDAIRGSQSKVGEFHSGAIVGEEDVLRLQVPMVDTNGVAILDGIQDLEKGVLGQLIVADKVAEFGNVGEQVALGTILNHAISALRAVQDAKQGEDIGMLAGLVMEGNFAFLEPSLSGVQSKLGKRFDGVEVVGEEVDGAVDDSVGTHSKDGHEFQSASE